MDGNILFSNVEFAYPTRIDIQVAISTFGHGMKLNVSKGNIIFECAVVNRF